MKKSVFFSAIIAIAMFLTSCVGYYGARPGYYDRPYYRTRPNVYYNTVPVYPQRSYRPHHHGRRY